MSATFFETVILEKMDCGKCGGVFALNKSVTDHARSNCGGYNCPYCKTHWGWHESESDRLRKQLDAKERELREAKCETLRQSNLKEWEQREREKSERKLRRVHKGICPCCKRTFQNLQRHMETKHPESKP